MNWKENLTQSLKWSLIPLSAILLVWFYYALPRELFEKPAATVLFDSENQLLGATIANDDQWRFPAMDSLPSKFVSALVCFEDQYFFKHPGINPGAIFRALKQNWRAGKIVSGASTLSMQVIRLSRQGRPRSFKEKLIEMVLALRLEVRYSKQEILKLYATNAPFGGNTVGLETAAWRYYGTSPHHLSWGEAAMLAVLPNQPSLIYPGKHDSLLVKKRNRLLHKLRRTNQIDEVTLRLAIGESLPDPPGPLPQLAPHYLVSMQRSRGKESRIVSSIDREIQKKTASILARHHHRLSLDQIHNAAVVVADVKTGKILAYIGNSPTTIEHQNKVDIIQSKRSPGSTLKPFLFAASLDESLILPGSLLPDIPTYFQGFTPKNFSLDYDGAVPANEALVRSLNIPFVQLLYKYSYPKFNLLLKNVGFTSLTRHPDHYGLSIILGGAEVSLFDLANGYLQLMQKSMGFQNLHPLSLLDKAARPADNFPLSREACWHTTQALLDVARPVGEEGWQSFENKQEISWKTGTSFGFKDAWAVGMTTKYLVAVWVGNADGESRPNIIGSRVAAPILFDVFDQLGSANTTARQPPALKMVETCRHSGHRAGKYCTEIVSDKLWSASSKHPICPYHERIFVNEAGKRVLKQCADNGKVTPQSVFLLSPTMAKYYRQKHRDFQGLPSWSASCKPQEQSGNLAWIYPAVHIDLLIPQELDGTSGRVIFELAHQQPQQKVYWHLDNTYLGQTLHDHKLAAWIPKGKHELIVVDESGERLAKKFNVLGE